VKNLACTPTEIHLQRQPVRWWLAEVVVLGWVCHLTRHRSCITRPGVWLTAAVERHTDSFVVATNDETVQAFQRWMDWDTYGDEDDE